MKQFALAALAEVDEAERLEAEQEEEILEFGLSPAEEHQFRCRIPKTGQIALVYGAMGGEEVRMADAIIALRRFFKGVMLDDGYRRLFSLVEDGSLTFEMLTFGDDENEDGLFSWIAKEADAARPTGSPSGSSKSRGGTGKRSTGRAPGRGSIPSTSRSAGS